jgi:hypothetical protein
VRIQRALSGLCLTRSATATSSCCFSNPAIPNPREDKFDEARHAAKYDVVSHTPTGSIEHPRSGRRPLLSAEGSASLEGWLRSAVIPSELGRFRSVTSVIVRAHPRRHRAPHSMMHQLVAPRAKEARRFKRPTPEQECSSMPGPRRTSSQRQHRSPDWLTPVGPLT